MAFSFIRKQIDRDNQKWEEKAQRSRENGAKGGRPQTKSRLLEKPKKPTGFSGLSEKPKKPDTVTDNVNVNVNVINTPHKSPQGWKSVVSTSCFFM